jgi:hypothetical protein
MPHMIKKSFKPALAHFQEHRYVSHGRIKMTTGKLANDRAACMLVERYRALIRLKITGYFEKLLQKIPLHQDWLLGTRGFPQAVNRNRLLSRSELIALIDDIQQSVEQETAAFITKPILSQDSVTVRNLDYYSKLPRHLLQAYRDTLQISRYTEMIINKAWDHGYSALRWPGFIKMVMERLSLGTQFLNLINCSSQQHQARCQAEVSRQIAGTLEFVRDQLIAELCSHVARVIYDQYDTYIIYPEPGLHREVLPMLLDDTGTDAASQKKAV